MDKVLKKGAFLLLLIGGFSFISSSDNNSLKVKKSISEISEHLYKVSIQVTNGNLVNGIAKYEAKLPLSADFVEEITKDEAINFKLDGRKVKLIWMHIQKNRTYNMVFTIKSKLPIERLKMNGKMFGHHKGVKFSYDDSEALIIY